MAQGSFAPVRVRRAFEDIVVQLEDAIIEGRLGPGDRLPPERELADVFGVSRTSLREALRALESIGVLEARRGQGRASGSTVAVRNGRLAGLLALHAAIQRVPLADLVQTREALETLAARSAARQSPEPGVLEALVAAMRTAGSEREYLELDNEFHQEIARLSGNSLVQLLMEALREAMGRQMLRAFEQLEDPKAELQRLTAQHDRVAALIASGDGEGAAAALSAHIRGFYSRLLAVPDEQE